MTANQIGVSLALGALVLLFVFGHKKAPAPQLTPVPTIGVSSVPLAPVLHPPVASIIPRSDYFRVLPGGQIGSNITCKTIEEYSPEELVEVARQYHVTEEQIHRYKKCVND